ncbi:hypothetical protein [Paenisporosarcina sp. TG-14]|uniref:hypothetical protein n=1 Tax=Paenisporosarcina sp. TG-14 TaxID=1231057 RepID=UPI000316DEC1|nr:hypothetical protein [Paenisporosarcina sp. TG-14]
MKKKVGMTLALLLVVGGFFYYTTFFAYQPLEELSNFPIPKTAVLLIEMEDVKFYDWSRATAGSGIPFGYEIVLKANGWKQGEVEGASVSFTKGDHQIRLISQTGLFTLIKIK